MMMNSIPENSIEGKGWWPHHVLVMSTEVWTNEGVCDEEKYEGKKKKHDPYMIWVK